ncbi:hypothetical protein LSCM1_07460 [Leishmania martiniquensis]|uniref:Axonemal dynein light chain n=1 Tax=Leishmania martiniquensis TaxID=1580590 RepID=A0A836KYD8_9TRYP|nr:hypothetical protein LSCM1_07460 [Leishmania martiniquensis]
MKAVHMRAVETLHCVNDVEDSEAADAAVSTKMTATTAAALTTAEPHGGVADRRRDEDELEDAALQAGVKAAAGADNCPEDPLVIAFAQDAPLTLTARDDPRVVARVPLRFKDVLPTICHQLQFRQRQATQQTAVNADSCCAKGHPLSSPPEPRADATSYPPPPYQHAHLSDMVVRLLPVAVGQARGCKTPFMHPKDTEEYPATTTATAAAAAAAQWLEDSHEQHPHEKRAAPAGTEDVHEAEDALRGAPVPENQFYRTRVSEQLLGYLFSLSASSDGVDSVGRDEARRSFTVNACLSGMREVSSDTAEYVELLRQMVSLADARQCAESNDSIDGVDVHLPAYVRDFLVGMPPAESAPAAASLAGIIAAASTTAVPAVTAVKAASTSTNPSSGSVGGGDAAQCTAAAEVAAVLRAPVVAATMRSALDAVLPPRLFVFYSIHRETVVAIQEQRRAAQHRRAFLRRHLESHPKDANGNAEMERLGEVLAGEFAEAPVGVILVLLERASDVQAPRDYLLKLEQTLNEVLERVQARCCGRPLQLTRTSTAQQSRSLRREQHGASAPSPQPPPSSKKLEPRNMSSSVKAALGKGREATPKASTLAATEKQVCTRTLKPLPAQPAAMSASGGGSATVAATLNVLELNRERTLVQLSLLGEELLRQVTVDLPERGILLRRLLDEAQLSIDAHAILARERAKATQEHLLDGQDAREAMAARCKVLENDVAELRSRLRYVTARKAALEVWAEERKVRDSAASRERAHFERNLRERLIAHTERVKEEQDAARRSSLTG